MVDLHDLRIILFGEIFSLLRLVAKSYLSKFWLDLKQCEYNEWDRAWILRTYDEWDIDEKAIECHGRRSKSARHYCIFVEYNLISVKCNK